MINRQSHARRGLITYLSFLFFVDFALLLFLILWLEVFFLWHVFVKVLQVSFVVHVGFLDSF